MRAYLTISTLKFTSHPYHLQDLLYVCQKLNWLINSYVKYSCFRNSAIWLSYSIFDITQLKIYNATFMFHESITICQKTNWNRNIADLIILQFNWLRVFKHTRLKIYKPSLTFFESISAYQKSSWFIKGTLMQIWKSPCMFFFI